MLQTKSLRNLLSIPALMYRAILLIMKDLWYLCLIDLVMPIFIPRDLIFDAPAEQVVYHGRNNNSITAYGDYVAYSSRESDNEFGANTFNIYLISTKTDYIRRLTAIGNNQMPRFSKDGGSVMFLKHTSGQTALGVIRLDYNKSYLFPLNRASIQSFDW